MLPVAAGANGQPPRPPQLASSTVTPASTLAKALARPVLRVSWKCMRRRASGAAARTASIRRRTVQGSATPMVSASAISVTPSAPASRASATTWSSGTSPSNGQPKATERVTLIGGPPSTSRRATIAASAAIWSATPAPWLRMPKPSVAQTTTLASSTLAAKARSQPRSFSTRPMRERPGARGSACIIASAPAICGTRRSLTNDTASIRRAPHDSSRRTNSTLSAGARIAFSFCKPSRAPTSTIWMKRLIRASCNHGRGGIGRRRSI